MKAPSRLYESVLGITIIRAVTPEDNINSLYEASIWGIVYDLETFSESVASQFGSWSFVIPRQKVRVLGLPSIVSSRLAAFLVRSKTRRFRWARRGASRTQPRYAANEVAAVKQEH